MIPIIFYSQNRQICGAPLPIQGETRGEAATSSASPLIAQPLRNWMERGQ